MESSTEEGFTSSPMTPADGHDFPTTTQEDTTSDTTYDPPPTARESQILEELFQKEYEQGDAGKVDALHDLQLVFDELKDEKVIPAFDLLGTYKETQPPAEQLKTPRKKIINKMIQLTPRPPAGLFFRQDQQESASVPNLQKSRYRKTKSELNKEPSISLPSLTIPTSADQQRGKSKVGGRKGRPHHGGGQHVSTLLPSARTPLSELTETSSSSMTPRALRVSDAIDVVQKDLELITYHKEHPQQSSSSTDKEKVYDPDEFWKADLNKLTRARSSSKYPAPTEGDTIQLKYKIPLWPHQESLHQILVRMPTLTCLILDGSELRFLRDLGSSLPSLMTLSVAKCGIRSLDGTLGFHNLRTLIASDNKIQHPTECSFLPALSLLDLSGNPIQDLQGFAHLRVCTKLRSLKLHSTPVSKIPDFQPKMKSLLPQLKELYPIIYLPNKSKKSNIKKNKKEAAAAMKAEMDPLKTMMKMDSDLAYQRLVDKKKPTGIAYQHIHKNQNKRDITTVETSDTTPGTATSSTEDNLESILFKTLQEQQHFKDSDINSESYITDITEMEETEITTTSSYNSNSRTTHLHNSGQGDRAFDNSSNERSPLNTRQQDTDTSSADPRSYLSGDNSIQELFSRMKQSKSPNDDENEMEFVESDQSETDD